MSNKSFFSDLCLGARIKEGWLEKREKKGFVAYYVIVKTKHIFFFSSEKIEDSKKYLGFIELTPYTECVPRCSKGKRKHEFELRVDLRKIFLFRVKQEKAMEEWVSAIRNSVKRDSNFCNRRASSEEAAGFLAFRSFKDGNASQVGSQRKTNVRRAETIPGKSTLHQTDWLSPINTDIPKVPLSSSPVKEDSNYDPVVLYFRWYYPKMTRQEAENILNEQSVGTYLLRDTESANCSEYYTLSYRDKERIKHHKIEPRYRGKDITYVFHGDERIDFQTPGDAVIFIMSSKEANYPTKPYIKIKTQNKLKQITVERERTSGDGMEGKAVVITEDNYIEPVSPNDYLMHRQIKDIDMLNNNIRTKEVRSKSDSALPEIPFPELPSPQQLDEGLFGDYQNIEALRIHAVSPKRNGLHDNKELVTALSRMRKPLRKGQGATNVDS